MRRNAKVISNQSEMDHADVSFDEDKSASLVAVAYRRIRDSIAQSQLTAGSRLVDREISQQFMIGRTPVREALQRLESDGFLTRVPGKGLVVPRLDEESGQELAFVREELEGMAAFYCARTAEIVEIELMKKLLSEESGALNEPIKMREINRRLHNTIYFGGRNRLLSKSLISLRNSMLFLPTTLSSQGRSRHIHKEHSEIVNAIAERNPSRAEEAMRNHIRQANVIRINRKA